MDNTRKIRELIGTAPMFMPSAGIILYKDRKILMQKRADNCKWGLHGGAIEMGETTEETAIREVSEEIGITPESLVLYGVFSSEPMHHIYPDGNEVYIVSTVYFCDKYSGDFELDKNEVSEIRWFDADKLPEDINPTDGYILCNLQQFINNYLGVKNMEINKCIIESFSVIGKEGSTLDGEGFIEKLWADANASFNEVAHLAKVDSEGNLAGFWGAMSDLSRSFKPWEDGFTKGLYLAGVEVNDDSAAPDGWTKWTIPSYEYLYVKVEDGIFDTFPKMLDYVKENNYTLAGAVHDYICPQENGQLYMFFPIRNL